ncbi:MAG: hypothetical protein NTV88_00825 [Candidatus Micrarchaeota archaeon]|nr:hypothetical protein [Candidatus Micrarchaeota archaeon]
MQLTTVIVLAAFTVLLIFTGMALLPEIKREMPETAKQIHSASAFVKTLPGAVPDEIKLFFVIFVFVSTLYVGFAYFLSAWSGIKRF